MKAGIGMLNRQWWSVFAASCAVLSGACAGLLAAALLRVGANTTCRDVRLTEVAAACVMPTAAPWALIAGAGVGAAAVLLPVMVWCRR